MFRAQIKATREGIKHSRDREAHCRLVMLERSRVWWGWRAELYERILTVLLGLQKRYRREFGYLPFLHRDGHQKRVGLTLMAHARLSALEKEAVALDEKK